MNKQNKQTKNKHWKKNGKGKKERKKDITGKKIVIFILFVCFMILSKGVTNKKQQKRGKETPL